MKTRILRYLRDQHLALLALILVVAGGTAYAAGLAKDSVKSKQIKNDQVKSVDVKDQGLTGTDIADGSVGSPEIADGSVASAEILDGAVGSPEIGNDAVTADELANDAVIGQKIATGVIGGGKLSPGAVSRNKIEDGAIDASKVEDGTLGGADVADGSIGAADLNPSSVGSVLSKAGVLTIGSGPHDVLAVPNFGTLSLDCQGTTTYDIAYAFDPAISQTAMTFGHDPGDNNPALLSGPLTGPTVGFNTTGFTLLDGFVWSSTADRVLRIDYTAVNLSATECSYDVRATVSHNGA
jgi:hypothetical protein